jgi:hypothetical protein
MSTLSPLGVEMLLFPTVAAVSGAGALGVPENLDGESLFASMVTGALTSMHGDGLVHPPSPVGEAALVALPVQTAESFGGGANGVAHSATVIEKTVPPEQGFRVVQSLVGSDLRPTPASSHRPHWGLRRGDCATPKVADDSEASLWANREPKEGLNDEVTSGGSSLGISENGGMPTWARVPGVLPPWVPPVMTPVSESSLVTGFLEGSQPSGPPSPSGRRLSLRTVFGVSPTPFPQGSSLAGQTAAQPALQRPPGGSVGAGNQTPQESTTPIAADTTPPPETVAGDLPFQGQEPNWKRVDLETPQPDPIGPMGPASRGSRSEWKTSGSPVPRSVCIDVSTGQSPSVVTASTVLSGESPSVPRVAVISGSGEPLEEESARWGSAAAGRWWSLSSPGSMPETVATVSEPAAKTGFPSQLNGPDTERLASGVPQLNIQPVSVSVQNPSVALSPVSGPEVAAREWLPSGFTRLRQSSVDSWSDSGRVLEPVFRSIPAAPAKLGTEAVGPALETLLSKGTSFGEQVAPVVIAEPASGSGGQSLEIALSAPRDGGTEEVVPEAVGVLKMPEGTKSFPQPTNLPPSRSADIAYGGSGEPSNNAALDNGVGSESNSDKNPETLEKQVFQDRATPSEKRGDAEVGSTRNRSGMTHARTETAMASDRFQTSVPETAPQRRGAGSLDSEPLGSLSLARDVDPSMRMPSLAPAISELNPFPETAEAVALPQARSITRLSDQLSGEVVLLQRLRTASMTAVLRPDAGSELRVELRRRDGRVEIRATLERGDAQAIAEGWPELQQQLRTQGVHLLPLEREGSPDSSKASSDPADERSAHSGGRGRNQQPAQDSAPEMGGEAGQKARSHQARSAQPAALKPAAIKPAHRPLLESWA